MHGMNPAGSWHVDDPEGLANACEWMRRHLDMIVDNGRWTIPRSMSVCVIDKTNKRVIRVLGMLPSRAPGRSSTRSGVDRHGNGEVPK